MDPVFKALSDPNRRHILQILKQKDMTVTEILAHFNITMASLSHHLHILKHARLVVSQRQGQTMIYSLNTSVFEDVMAALISFFKPKTNP